MSDNASVYLDNHATTRIDPDVFESMIPWFTDSYGNAGSGTHVMGTSARDAVESARRRVADTVGATAREIVFTSGATESVNLAIAGVVSRQPSGQCVVPVTEHVAVLDVVDQLEREGLSVCRVPVAAKDTETPGALDLNLLDEMIGAGTSLVSVMFANNEIGTVHPISAIADIVHSHGALLHVDCAQAIGNCSIDVTTIGADLASFSAHKCHGPKGVGALYVRRQQRIVRINPQVFGGGQERGLRSGTLNVPGIVGMGHACELASKRLDESIEQMTTLRAKLWDLLVDTIPGIQLNGPLLDRGVRLPNNLNVLIPGIDGSTLLAELSRTGVAASAGSACSSEQPRPSHVLLALGLSEEEVRQSIRFGLSRMTTSQEIQSASERLQAAIQSLGSA
ncbi:MAG: cysteine desulfurase [Planctomycetaceae bacterium]|nr:cysteine desulfurase [Planctomycetaceae bacterium]